MERRNWLVVSSKSSVVRCLGDVAWCKVWIYLSIYPGCRRRCRALAASPYTLLPPLQVQAALQSRLDEALAQAFQKAGGEEDLDMI